MPSPPAQSNKNYNEGGQRPLINLRVRERDKRPSWIDRDVLVLTFTPGDGSRARYELSALRQYEWARNRYIILKSAVC
jgi:hypothetical protein